MRREIMTESRHYDVIIIGSGAGGGTLAHALAGSGKRVLVVERGTHVRREKEDWSSKAVNLAARYNTRETHTNSVLIALSRCENPTVFQKTLALNDFYFGSPEWPYPMGHISFVGNARLGAKLKELMRHQKCHVHGGSCHRASSLATSSWATASPSRASPTRTERSASGTTRRLRRSTPTVARTTSTICTWSTAASFRRVPR
jgi:choline dehydrogenase-like flavoprotein